MTTTCTHALKEWNAQVRALETGRTSLIVRKGGIVEQRNEFALEHRSFLLYPTFLHQNAGELRPECWSLLSPDPKPGTVALRSLAHVEAIWKIEDPTILGKLESEQCLNLPALERKFAYRNKPWVHALLLRVYLLEQPREIVESEAQRGCVSWVPLEPELELNGLGAVVSDQDFAAMKNKLGRRLG